MVYTKTSVLKGWHPGESLMQQKLGFNQAPGLDQMWRYVYAEMTDQQRIFHTSNLHFLPIVTLDKKGRPWNSILAAGDGQIGWIKSATLSGESSGLELKPKLWKGDQLWDNLEPFGDGIGSDPARDGVLFAGIGVEVATRRRNKMAGRIKGFDIDTESGEAKLTVHVYESTGNCPKYITIRSVEPHPHTNPVIIHDKPELDTVESLPSDVIAFIQSADIIWLGSSFQSSSPSHPSHLGNNIRGGRHGWVRVKPSDGRTLVLPDWSGNRFMSTLGNIEMTPVAAVTIVDWKTGDVLYLTGDAQNLVGEEAEKVMPMQKALTELRVTGYRFVKDAVPVRQKEGTEAQLSPYSPPVKLLREELEARGTKIVARGTAGSEAQALLEKIEFHSPTIATFTFRSSIPLSILPGQAIILDFKRLLGTPEYRHMASDRPSSVNDDFIRTWTISSYHPPARETDGLKQVSFQLTMKEKEGGLVTGALFQLARVLEDQKVDLRGRDICAGIIGVSGEFYLDARNEESRTTVPKKLLWVAGGIGVTPFLTMLRAIKDSPTQVWDVVFLLATREPQVLLPLIREAYGNAANVRMSLHVFTIKSVHELELPYEMVVHPARLGVEWFNKAKSQLKGRDAYVCGPVELENLVIDALAQEVGLEKGNVRKEGFAY